MSAYPIQELGPSNAVALTSCETPTTLTQVPYSAVAWAVPGCVLMAAVAAANWAAVGTWLGPLFCWTWTGTVAARDCASRALFSEECSPIAKITAVAPNAIAASVTAVRAGLANGAARPRPTGRGRLSRAASRWTAYPRAAPGAPPQAIPRPAH